MPQAGEPDLVIPLLVRLAHSSPPVRYTKLNIILIVILGIDDFRIRRFLREVLERALVWRGRLAIDLGQVATKERGNPVLGAVLPGLATLDADIGACMVDGKLAGGDTFGVESTKVRPLQDVFTVGDPVRDFERSTLALVCVARVESLHVALASITLALNDVLIGQESSLALRSDIAYFALNQRHPNEATKMIVPPPFKRNLLTTRESVLTRNIGLRVFTTILIDVKECVRPILSRNWREHVGMCEGGRSHNDDGKELAEHDRKEMKRRRVRSEEKREASWFVVVLNEKGLPRAENEVKRKEKQVGLL